MMVHYRNFDLPTLMAEIRQSPAATGQSEPISHQRWWAKRNQAERAVVAQRRCTSS